MKKPLHTIILASTSPRRKDLLVQLGIPFDVVASSYEEDMTLPLPPLKLPVHLSQGKARDVATQHPDAIVIGADTIVAIDETVLGKAHTPEEAVRMLEMLSGKTHRVITGTTMIFPDKTEEAFVSDNLVTFKTLTPHEIDWYVSTGEPIGKAGAYAIQGFGSSFVRHIEGSYTGIVGLPLEKVYDVLVQHNMWPGLS